MRKQNPKRGKFYDLTGLRITIDQEIRNLGSVFSLPIPAHSKEQLYNRRLLHVCALTEPYHDDAMTEELKAITKYNGSVYNHKLFAAIMRLHKRLNFGLREGGKTNEQTETTTITDTPESEGDDTPGTA